MRRAPGRRGAVRAAAPVLLAGAMVVPAAGEAWGAGPVPAPSPPGAAGSDIVHEVLTQVVPGLTGLVGHGARPGPPSGPPSAGSPSATPTPSGTASATASPAPTATATPTPTVSGKVAPPDTAGIRRPAGPLRPPSPAATVLPSPAVGARLSFSGRSAYGTGGSAPSLVPPSSAAPAPVPVPGAGGTDLVRAAPAEEGPAAVYEPARRVLRILPLGAGLSLIGLGLGFFGLRLRRA